MSLLTEALTTQPSSRSKTKFGPEDIELALAWVCGRISNSQVCGAKNLKTGGTAVYVYLALALRRAAIQGKIKEVIAP